jgi:3-oxoacyl-[acyl-carrier protein] reductase
VALELARRGADVAVTDSGGGSAVEAAEAVRSLGRRAMAVSFDVSDAAQVQSCLDRIGEEFGPLDILVNNAGITRDGLVLRMKEEDWDRVLAVNLKGAFLCTRAVARGMMKRRFGRIINITSVVGIMGNAGQANYASSKAGLIGLTRSLARELAGRNVLVNAVAPGFIDTAMTKGLPEAVRESMLRGIPLERFGSAEEVARVVAFLASSEADYITGQVINVDGGMVMS